MTGLKDLCQYFMTKFSKQYIYFIKNKEDKRRIRRWIGSHNGMSILYSDWLYRINGISIDSDEAYILEIKNKKTELLFKLTFSNVIEKDKFFDKQDKMFEGTNIIR